MDVASLLEHSAECYPDHTALVHEQRRWSYRDWHARVRRIAQALVDLGVGAGERVALYLPTSEYVASSYFAIQLLGAVAVPLNLRLSAGELTQILRDSGARALIYDRLLAAAVLAAQQQPDGVQHYICCGDDPRNLPGPHLHFDTLADGTAELPAARAPLPAHSLSSLIYTSGTTGLPKGVMHSHANDVAIAMNCVMEYGLRQADIALHIAPLYHVGGMQAFFIPHLMVGATNVVLGRYSALRALELIERERVTTLFAVPTQLQQLLQLAQLGQLGQFDRTSLRMITTGGAAISAAGMARARSELCAQIYNGYGMTEASLTLLLHPQDALRRLGSCGKPTLISSARIVANDPGREVGAGECVASGQVGELIVRGPQVTAGYWNDPQASARRLRAGWLYTGDLFSQDADGFYHYHGRVDDLIVSGGENIYPREVEEVLYRCPGVQDAAVVGLPDAQWGAIVSAFIVRSDPGLTAQAIDLHCRQSAELASFKRPRRVLFVDCLPVNPSGKVLKRELTARYAERRENGGKPDGPHAADTGH
jgi:fatty-acyl-CoA synthase